MFVKYKITTEQALPDTKARRTLSLNLSIDIGGTMGKAMEETLPFEVFRRVTAADLQKGTLVTASTVALDHNVEPARGLRSIDLPKTLMEKAGVVINEPSEESNVVIVQPEGENAVPSVFIDMPRVLEIDGHLVNVVTTLTQQVI